MGYDYTQSAGLTLDEIVVDMKGGRFSPARLRGIQSCQNITRIAHSEFQCEMHLKKH